MPFFKFQSFHDTNYRQHVSLSFGGHLYMMLFSSVVDAVTVINHCQNGSQLRARTYAWKSLIVTPKIILHTTAHFLLGLSCDCSDSIPLDLIPGQTFGTQTCADLVTLGTGPKMKLFFLRLLRNLYILCLSAITVTYKFTVSKKCSNTPHYILVAMRYSTAYIPQPCGNNYNARTLHTGL